MRGLDKQKHVFFQRVAGPERILLYSAAQMLTEFENVSHLVFRSPLGFHSVLDPFFGLDKLRHILDERFLIRLGIHEVCTCCTHRGRTVAEELQSLSRPHSRSLCCSSARSPFSHNSCMASGTKRVLSKLRVHTLREAHAHHDTKWQDLIHTRSPFFFLSHMRFKRLRRASSPTRLLSSSSSSRPGAVAWHCLRP